MGKFKAFVIVGDMDGHVGLGVECVKEVATAIRGAILKAKLSVVPVLRGFWGNKIGREHTVPCKVTGKCGSVRMRLIPAPRGTGLVASRASKRVLQYAGVEDVYTALVVPHPPWVTSSRLHSPQLPTPTPTTSQL